MAAASTPSLPELEALAQDALSSPSAEVRQAALEGLRYLSAYDQWDTLKHLFVSTTNMSLLFVVAKSIHFVVKNEIGPHERAEIQEYLLQYVQRCSTMLPSYLIKQVFSIYATALYLNWRLAVISEKESNTTTSMLGSMVEGALTQYLTPLLTIDCMKEIVHCFATEDSRTHTPNSVREMFSRTVLPHFFRYAEDASMQLGTPALELLSIVLESIPKKLNAPLVQVSLTTDDSIYVAPGLEWMPSLRRAVNNCGVYVLAQHADLSDAMTSACLALLRLASCVVIGDWGGRQVLRDDVSEFVKDLTCTANKLLQQFQLTRSTALLRTALAVLVNNIERDESSFMDMEALHVLAMEWGTVALACCERWSDDEVDVRQSLLHLFYLIARVAPKCISFQRCSGDVPEHLTGDVAQRATMDHIVRKVFESYFRNVIAKCHLEEESHELRCAEAIVLHSEDHLLPMAELLGCEGLDLSRILHEELLRSQEQYRACIALRRGEQVQDDMLVSLMVVSADFMKNMAAENIALFLANVVLSRIASIVTTVGLSVHCTSLSSADPLVGAVLDFLQQLVAPEDDVTDALLQCMTISPCDGQDGDSGTTHKLHLGVLRALFHFTQCLIGADEGISAVPAAAELCSFVLLRYSDIGPLVSDATLLLQQIVSSPGAVMETFVHATRVGILLTAMTDGKVQLLQPHTAFALSVNQQQAREGLLVVLSTLMEIRTVVTGSQSPLRYFLDMAIQTLTISDNASQCFRDLVSILTGLTSATSLLFVLEWIAEHHATLIGGIRDLRHSHSHPQVIRLISTIGSLCDKHVALDNVSPTLWEVASFGYNALRYMLRSRVVNRLGGDDYFPPNSVSEAEMYDIATWVGCTCGGSWVNLSVMLLYGDDAVSGTLFLAVEALLCIPVEVLISDDTQRHKVFNALSACLEFPFPPADLSLEVSITRVWPRLLTYLVQCLGYRFSHLVLDCIRRILLRLWPNAAASNTLVEPRTLQLALRDVAVALSTTESLNEVTYVVAFDVMRSCYSRDCEGSEGVLEHLLSFCSAYHRVRIRCILMMLRAGTGAAHAAESFLSVFGRASSQPTLAAF